MSLCEDGTNENSSINYCRVCLQPGEMPIFGSIDISENIIKFADIEIDIHDDFPKYLCNNCNTMLGNAILFRKTAQASDRILRHGEVFENYNSNNKHSDMDNDEKCNVREYLNLLFEEDKIVSNIDPNSDIDEKFSDIEKVEIIKYDKTFYYIDPDSSTDEERNDLEPYIPRQYLELEETSSDDLDDEIKNETVNDVTDTIEDFKCKEYDKSFKPSEELEENHLLQYDPKIRVKCDVCGVIVNKTSYHTHLQQHRDKYKQNWEKKYSKIECQICGTHVSKSYYKYHLKTHSTKKEKAEGHRLCPFCNKSYKKSYFTYHMKHAHEKVKKNNEKQEALKKQQLKRCPICDRNVKENTFKHHLAMHGKSPKRYTCNICGKVTIHPSAFKLHCMTHGAELKHKCQFCPYRALHIGLLKVHVRTHTKDYLYKCTECPASFITKSNLTMHQRKHGKPDDFKCDICNKTFYSKRNLNHHYTCIHLGIRNVICDICGKAFGNRNGMLNHQKKVHKRKNITNRVGRMPSYLIQELKKSKEHK